MADLSPCHLILQTPPSIPCFVHPIGSLYCYILTKLPTGRPNCLLHLAIDPDQTGFMAHKSTDINLRRLFTNIYAQHSSMGSRVVASLDIEKAFDRVEWPFLWGVLRRIGFPLVFIHWLGTLYERPTAALRLGGSLSSPFYLTRGYPLSGPFWHHHETSGWGFTSLSR